MTGWDLPTALTVGGREYRINADYRDVLEVIAYLQDPDVLTGRYVALSLFYEEFETMPRADYPQAMEELARFIDLGEEPDSGPPQPKTIDWEQDRTIIVSEINKVAGVEVRALPFLHWWTFLGYFGAIGEGQLSTIVAIREKLRKGKKLESWEREYYQRNRSRIDFKRRYTAEEEQTLNVWGV